MRVEPPLDGISVLIRETAGSSLVPSTVCGHSEQMSPVNQEVSSHQTPNLLVPGPQTGPPGL